MFFGRNAVSYVRTSLGYVRDSVENSVPVEFQIQNARHMIKDLDPEIRKNMHLVAKEEVEVQQLEDRIGRMESRMNEQKQDLLRLKTDLEQGKDKPVFTYAGRNYTKDQVKTDLANRFQRFKTDEATLESMRKIHLARQNSVEAARQKLEGWLASKRQLQVEVENIEAKRQMIAAAQSTSNYQFDDSQLGRVKELVSDLQTRLDVRGSARQRPGHLSRRDSAPPTHSGKHRGSDQRLLRSQGGGSRPNRKPRRWRRTNERSLMERNGVAR